MNDEEMEARFERGWGSGGRETRCGAGSTLAATMHIRPKLRALFDRYEVKSVVDAGAGDLNWMLHVEWNGIDYKPFDLIPRHPWVTRLDITRERLPSCDLILCRTVLNHLDPERVQRAINWFRLSGKYLLATQFKTADLTPRDFVEYDLRAFGLDEPIESMKDYPGELSLWAL